MSLIKKALYIIVVAIIFIFILITGTKAETLEITTETLNLRKEPSTESDIVALISIGEECELIEEEGSWYKVKYKDYTGYISKEYAKLVSNNNSTNTVETQSNDTNNETSNETNTVENNDVESTNNTIDDSKNNTNTDTETIQEENTYGKISKKTDVKIVPLINGSIVGNLQANTEVNIITNLNGWSYISTDSIAGWIRTDVIGTQDNKENNDNTQTGADDNNSNFTEKTMYTNDSYVNIRKEPNTSSNIIMTVEQNTELKVIGEEEDWYKVETSEGEAYVLKELLSDTKKAVTNRGNVNRTNTTEEKTETENTIETKEENNSVKGTEIVNYAKKFLGVPYVYGGASPAGFDCSGFTMYVYNHFGISMKHGAQAQAKLGTKISTDKSSKNSLINNLEKGDLVFFLDYETMDEIGHCGIYIGDGNFIHASSGSGYCVKINSLLPGEYYNTRYCGARRII